MLKQEGTERYYSAALEMEYLLNPETGNVKTEDGVIYWRPEINTLLTHDIEIDKEIHNIKKIFGRFGQFIGGAIITEVKEIERDYIKQDGNRGDVIISGSQSQAGEAQRERSQGTLF